MRTIVAGSRSIADYHDIEDAIDESGFTVTQVVSGCAWGADKLGEQWASNRGVPVARFPAEWGKYGKSAGYRRNEEMSRNADALVAIWDGESRGTQHMINIANAAGLKVYVKRVVALKSLQA